MYATIKNKEVLALYTTEGQAVTAANRLDSDGAKITAARVRITMGGDIIILGEV